MVRIEQCLQVVVIDEIGTEAETHAARTISQRGVQLIATAHGTELESLIKNPSLVDLVGGIGSVTLGALFLCQPFHRVCHAWCMLMREGGRRR